MYDNSDFTEPYDVIVIGAGPAGLFCALELIENQRDMRLLIVDKGHTVATRKCPALNGACTNCRVCHLISGIGGAGLYSDGKVVLDLNVGGHLRDYDPTGQSRKMALTKILDIFSRFNLIREKLGHSQPPSLTLEQQMRLDNLGLRVKQYPVAYYGSNHIQEFVANIANYLTRLNVKWSLGSEVQTVIRDKNLITITYSQGGMVRKLSAKRVIFATGKEGSYWTSHILADLGVSIRPNWTCFGVRVETTFEQSQALFDAMGPDPKISYKFADGTKIKTHCSCRGGKALISKYFGYSVVGGHTPDPLSQCGNSTFTILLRTPPELALSEWQVRKILAKSDSLANGKLLVQTLGGFQANVPSSTATIRNNKVHSTILENVTAGNIRALELPFDFDAKFLHFIDKLGKLCPGILSPTTLLYAPAVEWWMPRIEVGAEMETSVPGIYAIGDGAGLSQGITHAAATGIIAARSILEQLNSTELRFVDYKRAYAPTAYR